MTEEEQNRAIAEACGWREAFPKNGEPHLSTKEPGILLPYYWINERTGEKASKIPDYVHDLNSMYKAVMSLNDNMRDLVNLKLCELTDGNFDSSYVYDLDSSINAPAEKRAEAFLKCKGLWKN